MRRLALVLAAVLIAPGAARAASSANVQPVAQIPTLAGAISINFIDDAMFVSTAHGVYSYDVADPAHPKLLGALPMYIWENEDVDVDRARKRLFISRDPRGFTSPGVPGNVFPYGAVHIIDVSDPAHLEQLNMFLVPAGHTTTCVNRCDVLWTAGPGANPVTNPGLDGRPIYATDVTDPANPKPCDAPIDVDHDDGASGYVHDVQVDRQGIAWVTGQGGVRGYWTEGSHRNPLTGQVEQATGCTPIPFAGAGSPETATTSRFMHNAWRDFKPVKKKRKKKAGVPRNDVLLATEENIVSDCKTSGRFVAYDIRGTHKGQGFGKDTAKDARLKVLDTWTPEGAEGSEGCDSAHYFTSRGDGITVNAFYTKGVRFLDTRDPTNIRQIGYFVNVDSNTWAAYWHKGYVFVADLQRGVDVLKLDPGSMMTTVKAPRIRSTAPTLEFGRDTFGGLCPLTLPAA